MTRDDEQDEIHDGPSPQGDPPLGDSSQGTPGEGGSPEEGRQNPDDAGDMPQPTSG